MQMRWVFKGFDSEMEKEWSGEKEREEEEGNSAGFNLQERTKESQVLWMEDH